MDNEKLSEILEKHKKWLNNEHGGEQANLCGADLRGADLCGADLRKADLCGADLREANLCRADLREASLCRADLREADLRGADLRRADLHGADLREADLREADLRRANLDYSCWPLWCGSLKADVDDRIAIQLLYHTLSVVQHSPYVSDELKRTLLIEPIVDAANWFHRVDECGNLSVYTGSGGDRA